jgi:MFS family permease
MYGRLPLYHSCNLLFIIFTIAAAVAPKMSTFIVFRFLMGCMYCNAPTDNDGTDFL